MTSPDEHDEPVADQPTEGEPQETAAPHPGGQPEDEPGGRHAARGDHSFGAAAGEMANETEVEGDHDAADAGLAAGDELILAQTELAERTLDLQRLQAEFLNYKRRVDRDRDLVRENATYSVLSGLLPVLDDIDRAREHGEVEGGFKAVADSLDRIVSGLGLTKFGAKGDEFDPNVHEALMHGHSSEVTTTTVDVVAQAGYRIGDRVVRAARVTVLDPES